MTLRPLHLSPVLSVSTVLACVPLIAPDAAAEPVDRIVVTATRTPADLASVGDAVTVIEAEEARRSQKLALSDLLAATPGVTAQRNGGLGTVTALRIRGAESEQTVVLIDGVKLNDPASPGGGFNFANLLVSDIARIEVLRGSQSVLWGSQAIGGVVNIVTPDPAGPLASVLDVQGGSHGTAAATARAQAGTERYGWRVGATYLTTDGISAFDEDLGGREEDGYRNAGVSARGHVHLSDSITAELWSTWWQGRSDFDGFPPPAFSFTDTREYGKTREWVSYAGLRIDAFEGRLKHRLGTAYTDTDRRNFNPDSAVLTTFDAVGRNLRYEYQGTLSLSEQLGAVFGLERERSELSTVSPSTFAPNPPPFERDLTLDSAYLQLQVTPVRALTFTAGARYDDHETFGDDTSKQAAIAWSVSPSTLLRTSYGEGFKAPTLYQLYSEYGTPSLDPEESEDWDAGIEQRLFDDRVALSATYFERDTEGMIDFVSCFGVTSPRCAAQPFGYYENVQRTHADGYELSFTANLTARAHLSASYSAVDARNRGRSNFNRKLRRRPEDSAAAQLTYDWPVALSTTLAAQYVGRSFDDAANRVVLDDYVLVDLRASYQVSEHWEVYGRIENLFDEDYETVPRYGSIGRGAYLGARVRL